MNLLERALRSMYDITGRTMSGQNGIGTCQSVNAGRKYVQFLKGLEFFELNLTYMGYMD